VTCRFAINNPTQKNHCRASPPLLELPNHTSHRERATSLPAPLQPPGPSAAAQGPLVARSKPRSSPFQLWLRTLRRVSMSPPVCVLLAQRKALEQVDSQSSRYLLALGEQDTACPFFSKTEISNLSSTCNKARKVSKSRHPAIHQFPCSCQACPGCQRLD
jgi:hypothetical protein